MEETVANTTRYWAAESLKLCTRVKNQSAARVQCEYQKPTGDDLKVNIDGAFHAATLTCGWGFVIRDSQGDVMGSAAGRLDHVATAMQAEATVCHEALHAASAWGMMKVQIETWRRRSPVQGD